MKRQTILKSTLCLLMALLCNVSWAQVQFTFTRGENKAATVTAPEGVTATMVTNVDWLTKNTMNNSVSVLCPNKNTKDATEKFPITFTLTVSGLTAGQEFNTLLLSNKAVNSEGNLQTANASTRHCTFELFANDAKVGTWADQNIWVPSGSTERVIALELDNSLVVGEDGALTLEVKIYKGTSNDGCFYGLTKIELVEPLSEAERLTYNISDGIYNNRTDNSSSDWRPGWTSTHVGKPSFTITAANGKNNMNAGSTEFIGMRPGDTYSCVYTLTLGETFTGYSFEAKSTNTAPNTNNPAHVITINGEQTTVGAEWTTFTVDACGTSTTFTLTGSNGHDLYIRNIKFEQDADAAATAAAAATANANLNIYGLQRHLGLVQNAGTGLEGNGQIKCNFPAATSQESGNAYANLIDGNFNTFFHSGYNNNAANTLGDGSAHYLQADLGKAVKSFRFYTKKRNLNKNNNRPTKITIEGSNDAEVWQPVTVVQNIPTNFDDFYSAEITSATAYKHYRFTVNTTSTSSVFFTFSEFYILPNISKVAETFDAVRNYRAGVTVSAATVLNEVYAWNTALTNAMPIVGADHFFFADTKQSDNSYVARYLYNNNGALATSTSLNVKDAKFIWTAVQPEGTEYYTLQNKGDNTKYISYGNNGSGWWVGTTAVQLDIKSNEAVHTGSVGIKRIGTDGNGKYMVTAADGGSFNRNSGKVNDGSWCSDYVFIPADLYEGLNALTIVSNTSKANAVFTWNENEAVAGSSILFFSSDGVADGTLRVKSCNPTYKLEGFYSDAAYTQKITEVTELPADMTVYAKFVLDIFSESYGDKWVSIVRKTNANHAIILGSDAEGANPIFNTLNYTNAGMVWSFVGTAENFKIYNKVSGEGLALTPGATSIGDGTTVKMVAKDNAQSWHLIEKGEAFAIAPVGNNDKGINSYGGDNALGSQIKFYGVNDGGTQWYFTAIDASKPLTLSVSVTGEQPYATTNTRVADLNTTINGATSSTVVKGNVGALTYYLPVGATFTLSNSYIYRGYAFDGFMDANGDAAEYTNATIPEGGLNITAKYSVDEDNKYQYLFYSPSATGHPYRIPAIATAPNGDIFAICDHRPCGADIGNGDVDIVVRISKDNGETWGEEFKIADGDGGSTNRMETGYGDPAIVVDRESNRILVMMVAGRTTCWNGRWESSKEGDPNAGAVNRVARVYGTYDVTSGEWQWTAPVEMTDHMYSLFMDGTTPTVTSMFIGSGKICQSRVVKKDQYYRLYCALWTRDNGNRVIYSDDFGGTWNVLGTINDRPASGGDEPKCEELPDGTVVLSSRKGGGRYFNLFTFSDDTYTTGSWGTVASSNDIAGGLSFGGNSTNGEIYKVKAIRKSDGKICDVMLQSVPTGGGRDNVAIFYKEMEYNADGTNKYTPQTFSTGWTKGKHVSTKGSCYSTMILQADGRLGFFFEEDPSGYCMVYIPYTIEDVTGGAYSLYTVNSTIGEYKIGTFYASEAMQIPEGIKAYVATNAPVMNGGVGVITMEELEGIIPAKTGAVLRGEADDYKFIPSISYGTSVTDNMLVGFEAADTLTTSKEAVAVDDAYSTYILNVDKNGENPGFYVKNSAFNVANNKAYLKISKSLVQNARAIYFDFDDNTTEIESVFDADNTGVIYDLQGRQLKQVTNNGIYIVNGKKVLK